MTDNVNHPAHYAGEIECIDAMIQTQGVDAVRDFCVCNAFKYLWRWKAKNGVEDLEKALWYLDKAIKICGEIAEGKQKYDHSCPDCKYYHCDGDAYPCTYCQKNYNSLWEAAVESDMVSKTEEKDYGVSCIGCDDYDGSTKDYPCYDCSRLMVDHE